MIRTLTLSRPAEPHPLRRRIAFNSARRAVRAPTGITAQDVREFLMAYCACFLAVSTFIA